MSQEFPTFYTVTPASVRYDKRLSGFEILIYGEITCMTHFSGVCWASNQHFADLFNVEAETISRWISKLVECGHIERTLIRNDKKEIIRRELRIINVSGFKSETLPQFGSIPSCEKTQYPIEKKRKGNNTSINNKEQGSEKKEQKEPELTSEVKKDYVDRWNRFCDHVLTNKGVSLTKLRNIVGERERSLRARLKEPDWSFSDICKLILKSDLLLGLKKGSGHDKWIVSFDWILHPLNSSKILEGKYTNKLGVNSQIPNNMEKLMNYGKESV